MSPQSILRVAAVAGMVGLGTGAGWLVQASSQADGQNIPVLVELFTSEGCSSCPPADQLLIRLDEEQPVPGADIIVVSEHVDYWDRLGWRDPFSSPAFTQRQEDYRQALGEPANYTPQMVVDGRAALIGSLESDVRRAVTEAARQPKASVRVEPIGPMTSDTVALRVHVTRMPILPQGDRAELWVAVTQRGLVTHVPRGENARRRLPHTAVARRLERIETLPAVARDTFQTTVQVDLDPDWPQEQLRVVAFLQAVDSRHVLGVGQTSLLP
jgi:hypothetical protein